MPGGVGGRREQSRLLPNPGINTPCVTGFLYNDFGKLRKARQQTLPDPPGQVFAGRILESVDIIQAVMIKLIEQGLEGTPQIGKIHHPPGMLTNRATDVYFDSE